MSRPGSIVKVIVNNFVTYTYAELDPGDNLNMIIGPNGSGKSTMVAAIILGLGGSPTTVGRGKRISEYIKYNYDIATIEITLHGENKYESITIIREFDRAEKSKWRINDKGVSQKDVMNYIKKFNIQVDNLCQFLPQDKVADFAKMNKQQLLCQTKIALCREDLAEKQNRLISARQRHVLLTNTIGSIESKYQETSDEILRLEGKVTNFKKKLQYLDQIKNISRKKAWLQFFKDQKKFSAINKKKIKAEKDLEELTSKTKPMMEIVIQCRSENAKIEAKERSASSELLALENSFRNKLIARDLNDAISRIKYHKQNKLKEIEAKKRQIVEVKMKLDALKGDEKALLEKVGESDELKEKMLSYQNNIRQISSSITNLEQKKHEVVKGRRNFDFEIRGLDNEITQLKNVKAKRLNLLRQRSENVYEATIWLRENKNIFRGEVYEPIMMEINVTNPDHATYVENSIAYRDMVAFTCTDKDDLDLFKQRLQQEKNITVGIVHSGDMRPEVRESKIGIEKLRRYGFQTYVSYLFSAPDPIMNYLCKTNQLQNIPIAFKDNDIPLDDIPSQIRVFYKGSLKITQSVSIYSREKSLRNTYITPKNILNLTYDQVRAETITGEINRIKQQIQTFDQRIRSIDENISELNERNTEVRQNIQKLRDMKVVHDGIAQRIQQFKQKLREAESDSISEEDIERECSAQIKELLSQQKPKLEKLKSSYESFCKKLVTQQQHIKSLNIFRKQSVLMQEKYQNIQDSLAAAADELAQARTQFNIANDNMKEALRKAKELSEGIHFEDNRFNKFKAEYDKLSDKIDDLDSEEEILQGKIDCVVTAANQMELERYESLHKTSEALKNELETTRNEFKDISDNMDSMKAEWLDPLNELIGQISQRFGRIFSLMGCAGEVNLYTAKDDKDFEDYGLSILVTYRNGEPLQELNNVVQSGGERAVATAAFMLALQDLTPVPFRCVDEINQGMDTNNERRIFEMLVELTSKPETPQYFLITPKILPNLKFDPTIKIHFVNNGPFVCTAEQWNTRTMNTN